MNLLASVDFLLELLTVTKWMVDVLIDNACQPFICSQVSLVMTNLREYFTFYKNEWNDSISDA